MRGIRRGVYLLLAFGMSLTSSLATAAGVEAKKDGVEVKAEPEKDAAIVATLKKGDVVESVERKGMFWKVKTDDGKTGYVSVLQVKRQSSSASLAKAIRAAAKDGRDEREVDGQRARSAVMGVRGLSDNNAAAFAANAKPNMRMVYKMEDTYIPPKKIEDLSEKVANEVEQKAVKRGIAP